MWIGEKFQSNPETIAVTAPPEEITAILEKERIPFRNVIFEQKR